MRTRTQLCISLEQQKDDSERCERDNIVKALQCDELHEQLTAQTAVIDEHVNKIAAMHDEMTELRQLVTQVGSHSGWLACMRLVILVRARQAQFGRIFIADISSIRCGHRAAETMRDGDKQSKACPLVANRICLSATCSPGKWST
jgi:hypothetical protein